MIASLFGIGISKGCKRPSQIIHITRTSQCIFGNSPEDFTSSPQLGEVKVLVLAVFAGGNPQVIAELWPRLKVSWAREVVRKRGNGLNKNEHIHFEILHHFLEILHPFEKHVENEWNMIYGWRDDFWKPSCVSISFQDQVRWIHSLAAGVDTLVPVLNSLGPEAQPVPVTNAKGAFSRSLAEYGVAAMMHFNKQITRLQVAESRKKRGSDFFVHPFLMRRIDFWIDSRDTVFILSDSKIVNLQPPKNGAPLERDQPFDKNKTVHTTTGAAHGSHMGKVHHERSAWQDLRLHRLWRHRAEHGQTLSVLGDACGGLEEPERLAWKWLGGSGDLCLWWPKSQTGAKQDVTGQRGKTAMWACHHHYTLQKFPWLQVSNHFMTNVIIW